MVGKDQTPGRHQERFRSEKPSERSLERFCPIRRIAPMVDRGAFFSACLYHVVVIVMRSHRFDPHVRGIASFPKQRSKRYAKVAITAALLLVASSLPVETEWTMCRPRSLPSVEPMSRWKAFRLPAITIVLSPTRWRTWSYQNLLQPLSTCRRPRHGRACLRPGRWRHQPRQQMIESYFETDVEAVVARKEGGKWLCEIQR